MTNGDYIRQMMTDENIAHGFCGIKSPFNGVCDGCPLYDNPHCASYEESLKWVKAKHVGEEKTEPLSELQEIRDILSDFLSKCVVEREF